MIKEKLLLHTINALIYIYALIWEGLFRLKYATFDKIIKIPFESTKVLITNAVVMTPYECKDVTALILADFYKNRVDYMTPVISKELFNKLTYGCSTLLIYMHDSNSKKHNLVVINESDYTEDKTKIYLMSKLNSQKIDTNINTSMSLQDLVSDAETSVSS